MRRILLVEDEDVLRETYELILSTQPFILDIAENGLVALEKCQDSFYDLILLDLMMPIVDGVEFMRRFMPNAPESTRIVILSNLSSGIELDTAMQLGASQSMLKASMTPRQLLAAVRYELEAI